MTVQMIGRPKSRLGTPQHTGPYAHLRTDPWIKLQQGVAVLNLVFGGCSLRQAAAVLGLSTTTAYRRYWFSLDCLNSGYLAHGGPVPHQRSTRAVPRGRPILLPRDSVQIYHQLRREGISDEEIAASRQTIPKCIRAHAEWSLMAERLDDEVLGSLLNQVDQRAAELLRADEDSAE